MKDNLLYKILRPLITFVFKILVRPKFIGLENIPKKGRVILAGNHTSIFDAPLLISSTKRNVHFLAKKELWKWPKRIIFGHLGLIPVDRKSRDGNALITAERYLKKEKLIGIFPEGTRIKEPGFGKAKAGLSLFAIKGKAQVVPISIISNYKLFNRVTIYIDKPISFEEYYKQKLTSEENERLSQNVLEVIKENYYIHSK